MLPPHTGLFIVEEWKHNKTVEPHHCDTLKGKCEASHAVSVHNISFNLLQDIYE
jgi:hypothetical protein